LRPFDIIIDGMAAAMTEVGKLYESGDYFLPQLVMAGATMQDGMGVLTPLLKDEGGTEAISKGKVILGTVKGDLHDIGKNLVKIMLEGARFEVIDLGVDVGPDKFVEAVKDQGAKLVAMSALLTTTIRNMKLTMETLEAAGLRDQVKVMIGGAPLSREFANQIGAEGYASTAVGAVYEAERLLGV
jgi:5-methyltetrahydrofolate--homocysteine methyltransferase